MEQKLILIQKQSKEQELVNRFRKLENNAILQYKIVSELMIIKKGYSQRKLANLLGIPRCSLQQLLSWKFATLHMKLSVKNSLISAPKAMYIIMTCNLRWKAESEADNVFDKCMYMDYDWIKKYGKRLRGISIGTIIPKQFSTNYIITRSIQTRIRGLIAVLFYYNKIPKAQLPKLLNTLIQLRDKLDSYISKIRENLKSNEET